MKRWHKKWLYSDKMVWGYIRLFFVKIQWSRHICMVSCPTTSRTGTMELHRIIGKWTIGDLDPWKELDHGDRDRESLTRTLSLHIPISQEPGGSGQCHNVTPLPYRSFFSNGQRELIVLRSWLNQLKYYTWYWDRIINTIVCINGI